MGNSKKLNSKKSNSKNEGKMQLKYKIIIAAFVSLFLSYLISAGFERDCLMVINDIIKSEGATVSDLCNMYASKLLFSDLSPIDFFRIEIFFVVLMFIALSIILDTRKMYQFLFDKRWIVGGCVLLFLVINQFNGDSLTMYDSYFQQGEGSDFVYPVIGRERAIRSDEWMVNSVKDLSQYQLDNKYSEYNYLLRASNVANEGRITFANVFSNPFYLVKVIIDNIFGMNCGYSFKWYAPIILGILISIEFFLIITKGKRLLSFTSTMMIYFSSFYLWWGFPGLFMWMQGALTCLYYFITTDSIKKRCLIGYGAAVCGANFIYNLYPAWQVPLAYVMIVFIIWIFKDNLDKVKKLTKLDWLIFSVALFLIGLFSFAAFYDQRVYMEAISNTVYPGARINTGNNRLRKLFDYTLGLIFSLIESNNNSETGMFITFCPIPMIGCLYYMIKKKKPDFLTIGLTIVTLFIGWYCSTGVPMAVAKYSLMSNSIPERAVDIIGYVQVIFFALFFSKFKLPVYVEKNSQYKYNKNNNRKRRANNDKNKPFYATPIFWMSLICSIIVSYYSTKFAEEYVVGYMGRTYLIFSTIILSILFFNMLYVMTIKRYERLMGMVIVFALITGSFVRPICKGTDAIYSKPIAKEVKKIVAEDPESRWIGDNTPVNPSLLIACGARTINSTNVYPNLELWNKLDPEKQYNDVYNRYCHVVFDYTDEDTSFELLTNDMMLVHLSYKDFDIVDVDYIFSTEDRNADNEYVKFEKIYDEYGSYIYKVIQK